MKNIYAVTFICFSVLMSLCIEIQAQSIATFSSVAPGTQTSSLVIPSTHTFQRIIKSGDALTAGGTLGNDLDFTGYVPITGSSRNGYLSISSESTPAAVATMSVSYNYPTHTWLKSNSGNVVFPTAAFGTTPTSRFCSGTVTPNGTILVSEESVTTGDGNGDGYTDIGWLIEIDPTTRAVKESDGAHAGVDKLWAIGRASRENALIVADNKTLYTGADAGTDSYVYKFVATTAGDFSSGQLYVLVTTGALGTGSWALLANTTQANRNNTVSLSTAASAYSFNGVEDIELGPIDGKIYFTAKGPGRIYRFTDNGATVSNLEVFVENATYDVDPGAPVANEAWGIGNDNLAFDGEGNLWVLQDGGRNHIWVVGPTHTAAAPAVRLFGKTPSGSEPTGITFTPDFKFMFISLQHPGAGNSTSQLDAAGVAVIFNTHTTVVIARTENLGPTATLPVNFTDFKVLAEKNTAEISWSVSNIINHAYFDVERSVDSRNFEKIHTNTETVANGSSQAFNATDRQLPAAQLIYYRIKQVSSNGSFQYSEIKAIRLSDKESRIAVFPNPANELLNIEHTSEQANNLTITVSDGLGRIVLSDQRMIPAGKQIITVDIHKLTRGNYTLFINNTNSKNNNQGYQFTKM